MVEKGSTLRTAVFDLIDTMRETDPDPKLRAGTAETVMAVADILPLMTTMKNSWSNNFNAKTAWKHKTAVAAEIASQLMDGILVLHGVATEDAYTNMYDLIRPRVSRRWLSKGDKEVMRKIFGQFSGTGLNLEQLEADFLVKHPEYANGTKRKRDPKAQAAKVVIQGLTDNLPEGYVADKALQEQVYGRFTAFMEAIKEEFEEAGLGELEGCQVNSVLVGSLVHQYFAKGKFGEEV